jgi:hypothetical protein
MKTIVAVGFLFFSAHIGAQNLVPNPSFEDTLVNPAWNGFVNSDCALWRSPSPGSAKYGNDNNPFVPGNASWYQVPRTGAAWTLLYTNTALYGCPNCRDVLQVKLTDTLKQGKKYCVSFYVSRSDYCNYACNNIGALLSPTLITNSNSIVTITPTINNDFTNPLLSDSTWMEVSGSFVANGNEQYIIIGNFNSDATSDTVFTGVAQAGSDFASYMVDDVSVIEITSCNAGNNTTICGNDSLQLGIVSNPNATYSWQPSNGLSNTTISNPKASPLTTTTYTLTQTQCDVVSTATVTVTINNDCSTGSAIFIPTLLYGNDQLKIQGLESNSLLEIFDARGRKVFVASDYQNDFSAFSLSQGIYLVRFTRPNGIVMQQKLCVVR